MSKHLYYTIKVLLFEESSREIFGFTFAGIKKLSNDV